MAGIVGTRAVILLRGPYTNHAWISIRSRENKNYVVATVWYLALENAERYEDED